VPAGVGKIITISASSQLDQIQPEAHEHLDAARSRSKKVRVTERLTHPHPIIAGWIGQRERDIR
jgi:hypothetical protein